MDFGRFIQKLQSADDGRKKRWLLGGTIVAMGLVLFVWAAYFSGFSAPAAATAPADEGGFSFAETVKAGAEGVYRWIIGAARKIGAILGAPRDYLVNPPH